MPKPRQKNVKTEPERKKTSAKGKVPLGKASNRNTTEAEELKQIFLKGMSRRERAQFQDRDLQAIADGFISFAETRKPGQVALRIFNPDLKKDGYFSRHTVLLAVNDDMPFLVDSTASELNRLGVDVHVLIHPIVYVRRSAQGKFQGFAGKLRLLEEPALVESWMYIEIDETLDARQMKKIADGLKNVLHYVRLAVTDWRVMRNKLLETISSLPRNEETGLPAGEREETGNFLAWMEADNFTVLGMRDYRILRKGVKTRLEVVKENSLGILSDDISVMFFTEEGESTQNASIQNFLDRHQLALITKTHRNSMVHRPSPMDAVLIKRFDKNGKPVGERLFIGLFTSSAYRQLPVEVPLIRGKIDTVLTRADLDPVSHDGKALAHILNSFPRDELFQISTDELYETAMGILHLQERQRLALFVRHDAFNRFVNCLIFVPRDRYDTKLRRQFQKILLETFHGVTADYQVKITTDLLAQIFIVVRSSDGKIPSYDRDTLEKRLQEASRGWAGQLKDELITAFGENHGLNLARKYVDAFPDPYCDIIPAYEALKDIAFIEDVVKSGKPEVHLYRPETDDKDEINLKWFNPEHELSLSQILPLMQNMGLVTDAEFGPYEIIPKGCKQSVWVHDCHARVKSSKPINVNAIKQKFEKCLLMTWHGKVESDAYNQLVLLADLSAEEVVILRAIGKYLRQAGLPYSEEAVIRALAQYPNAAQLLVKLFLARHDPAGKDRTKECARLAKALQEYLNNVELLEQDRILRRYLNFIECSLRTNFFQKGEDGAQKSYLSIKLDSRKLDDLPLPRPMVEIFVYSPRIEGIHLRGGKVARGGIRWSDRREDFRTEILSLMKAQQVKNTVIVPVGSKGGFVVKTPNPANPYEEGVVCYQTLMRGLLDLTDNRVDEKIVPPKNIVRHDGDDPYLVVAADKGTAKFSDIANAISAEYGFWLGDAFASGGSVGYDHKKIGITARGVWEAVKRHSREMGKDVQRQEFSVAGVGDMSGDVFGNGMLLSPRIRLIGAFNHKHIFIDPAPDLAISFAERKRLFELPGSQWSDYNKKLISKGGGVYNRHVKNIKLSREVRDLLNINQEEIAPDRLIQALLKARVELLFFGGIGTYVKAAEESHMDVGDRTNDGVRVNAEELRASVVGEGANLGMTQLGRIAYALKGGRLNTDAIDNSAGVDTSDHEVNIKILLDPMVRSGALSLKGRNQLLARMTDEVAHLVLRDNYLQVQALSLAEARAAELFPVHARLMHTLERKGLLDRKVEFLPGEDDIQKRQAAGKGLTRPELAVLMAYAKIDLNIEITASPLPDNPALQSELQHYFPKPLEIYADAMHQHGLRREIIATTTNNSVINRGGPHFIQMLQERTGKPPPVIAGAFAVLREVYELRALWADIEKLDNSVPVSAIVSMHTRICKMVERTTPWYVEHADLNDTASLISQHRAAMHAIRDWMESSSANFLERDKDKRRWEELATAGVPVRIARQVLSLQALGHVPDIATIAAETNRKCEDVAAFYFGLETRFNLFWLRNQAREVAVGGPWQREALNNLIDDLYRIQPLMMRMMLKDGVRKTHGGIAAAINNWIASREDVSIAAYDTLTAQITKSRGVDFAMLSLALRQLQQWISSKNGLG